MMYLISKSLHIIGIVCWFAGLFYLVRLFVYFREAHALPEAQKDTLQNQYLVMIRRLYQIITTPAMVLTVLAGGSMLVLNPDLLHRPWMMAKLVLVCGLLYYHWYCGRIIAQMVSGSSLWTSFRYRLFNEIPTVLLVAIVFLAVMKNTFNALYGLIGFIIFTILLFTGASWYKKRRQSTLNR